MQTISPWLSVTDEGTARVESVAQPRLVASGRRDEGNANPTVHTTARHLGVIAPPRVACAGKLFLSEAAAGGFIGGSVGVIGTVVSTFMKRDQVKDRLKCPYCYGTGQIVCGRCYGTGLTTSKIAGTDEWQESDCNTCERAGTVVCINCQGSGLSVPEDILQKLGDSEVGFTEEDYIGLFDEVKFPTLNNQGPSGSDAAGSAAAGSADEASERDEVLVAAGEKEAGPSPEDFTGGLG